MFARVNTAFLVEIHWSIGRHTDLLPKCTTTRAISEISIHYRSCSTIICTTRWRYNAFLWHGNTVVSWPNLRTCKIVIWKNFIARQKATVTPTTKTGTLFYLTSVIVDDSYKMKGEWCQETFGKGTAVILIIYIYIYIHGFTMAEQLQLCLKLKTSFSSSFCRALKED